MSEHARRQSFPDTHWSVVLLAAQAGALASHGALQQLCSAYWYPLYGHLRARGRSHHEAEDLVQAFLTHVCERQTLSRADRFKGSFRGYLLGCLRYFLANEREHRAAVKRGGAAQFVSIDVEAAEYWPELADSDAPQASLELDFDRRWAQSITQRAMARLTERYQDRMTVFTRLKGFLIVGDESSYADVAAELGCTEAVVKTTVHRMRRQFRDLLRSEVASTVSAPHEVDPELRHLVRVLSAE